MFSLFSIRAMTFFILTLLVENDNCKILPFFTLFYSAVLIRHSPVFYEPEILLAKNSVNVLLELISVQKHDSIAIEGKKNISEDHFSNFHFNNISTNYNYTSHYIRQCTIGCHSGTKIKKKRKKKRIRKEKSS